MHGIHSQELKSYNEKRELQQWRGGSHRDRQPGLRITSYYSDGLPAALARSH
jgi:hypothetical protein